MKFKGIKLLSISITILPLINLEKYSVLVRKKDLFSLIKKKKMTSFLIPFMPSIATVRFSRGTDILTSLKKNRYTHKDVGT